MLKIATLKNYVNIEETVKFLMSDTRSVDSVCDRI